MHPRIIVWGLAAAFMAGCSTQVPAPVATLNDPTNPSAPEAILPTRSAVLASTSDYETTSPAASAPEMPHEMATMNMGEIKHGMPGMGAGDPHLKPEMSRGQTASDAAANGDAATRPASPNGAAQTAIYTCPMHPQVLEKQPGKCPICGMKLVQKAAQTQEELNK